jgi:phosphate:Na+ symporter
MAIDAARREVVHLGERVGELFDAAVPAILDAQHAAIDPLHSREQVVDRHHAAILEFVEKVLRPELAPDVCRTAVDLVEAADYLESIGDLVDKEMIPLYRRHLERGTEIDPQARERLRALADAVGQELRRALRAVAASDQTLARSVLDSKSQVRSLERAAVEFQIESQPADGAQRLLPNALERELTESIRRTYSLVRRLVRVGTGLPRIDTEESI